MTEQDDTKTALQKTDSDKMLTYAKWGLMGIGTIALLNIVTGLIFNPLGLLALAGGGGFAWWHFKGRRRSVGGESAIIPPAPAPSSLLRTNHAPPASSPPVRPTGMAPVPQRGTAAPLAPPVGPSPQVPGFAADELAEFDRRLAELDAVD